MAVPSKGTIPASAQLTTRKKKVRTDIVIALTLLVFLSAFYSIVKPTMHIVAEQEHADLPLKKVPLIQPVETIESDVLDHEQEWVNTIKSCIPQDDKKCGTYVPEQTQRVALIAPPGQLSNMLWHWVQQVAAKHKKTLSAHQPIEFIRTSHVPPYGYGKTHGLTKIIRLVPKPLVMGVADALQQIIVEGESNHHASLEHPLLHQDDITLSDLKAVTRQFLRFHCRLTKLAAHTAILSLNLDDFMDNEEYATQTLYDFLKYDANAAQGDGEGDDEVEEGAEEFNGAGGMDEVSVVSSELGFVSKILTRIQAQEDPTITAHHGGKKVTVLHVLDEVLRDELFKSKNFTNWPCESFWTVGEAKERTHLSPFAIQLARTFSPNCTAPFTQCWVKRDLCEAKGDGVCREQP